MTIQGVGFIRINGEDVCLEKDGGDFGVCHWASTVGAFKKRLVSYRIFGLAHLRFYGKPSPKQLQKLRELDRKIYFEYWKNEEWKDMPINKAVNFFTMVKMLKKIYKL
jgi:hypothetical protein